MTHDILREAWNALRYNRRRTALTLSLLLGPVLIRRLSALQIGQSIRDDGPKAHATKAGTPCCSTSRATFRAASPLLRAWIRHAAPVAASSKAIARPMPLDEPVTTAVNPASSALGAAVIAIARRKMEVQVAAVRCSRMTLGGQAGGMA